MFEEPAYNVVDPGSILGQADPLEMGMATHSNTLAWRIPWTKEPGGLQSMEPQRVDTTEQLTLSLVNLYCSLYVCFMS